MRSGEGGLDSEYVAQYLSDRIVFEIIESEFDRRGLELTDEDRAAGRAELEGRLAPAPDPSLPVEQQDEDLSDVEGFSPEVDEGSGFFDQDEG